MSSSTIISIPIHLTAITSCITTIKTGNLNSALERRRCSSRRLIFSAVFCMAYDGAGRYKYIMHSRNQETNTRGIPGTGEVCPVYVCGGRRDGTHMGIHLTCNVNPRTTCSTIGLGVPAGLLPFVPGSASNICDIFDILSSMCQKYRGLKGATEEFPHTS